MNLYEIAQACMDATAFTAPEDTAMLRTKMALVIDKALTKARAEALREAALVALQHEERNRGAFAEVAFRIWRDIRALRGEKGR